MTKPRENSPGRESEPSPSKNENAPASLVPGDSTTSQPVKKLSAEEQMAAYEEHLKETDWGHQPC